MKRFLVISTVVILLSWSAAAQQRYYLFPGFVTGHIEFYDHSHADVLLNFDALDQKILYLEGDNLMEMTNLPMVKVLQADDRVFVVKEGLLCEVLDRESGPVLVNWRFRKVNRGSKGAMGLPTQGKVEAMRISPYDLNAVDATNADLIQGTYLADVWKQENANIYFIGIGGNTCKLRSERDLYKKFPTQAPQLKQYVKEHHLSFYKLEDVLQMLDQLKVLSD